MDNSFLHAFQGAKVLVTGHSGFKGSWLTLLLHQLGAHVYGFSNSIPTSPSLFEQSNVNSFLLSNNLEFEITDSVSLLESVNLIEPDYIFHLAAQPIVATSITFPALTWSSNAMGTISVLDAFRQSNQSNQCVLIIITSDKCYENTNSIWGYKETDVLGGLDPYSSSKAAAELAFQSYYRTYFRNHSTKFLASVRAGNVIGGGDWAYSRIVPDAMRSLQTNTPLSIRSPHATRPWQHVLEPLRGYLTLASFLKHSPELSGQSFNFGPNPTANKTVSELLALVSSLCPDFHYYVESDNLTAKKEAGLLQLNIEKARHYLEWSPVLNFHSSVELTTAWYINTKFGTSSTTSNYTIQQISEYLQLFNKLTHD